MKTSPICLIALFLGSLIASTSSVSTTHLKKPEEPRQYFVYVDYPNGVNRETFDNDVLAEVLGSTEAAKKALMYHYHTVMSGFAARLTPSQAESIKKNPRISEVVETKGGIRTQLINWGSNNNAVVWICDSFILILGDVFCLWPFC